MNQLPSDSPDRLEALKRILAADRQAFRVPPDLITTTSSPKSEDNTAQLAERVNDNLAAVERRLEETEKAVNERLSKSENQAKDELGKLARVTESKVNKLDDQLRSDKLQSIQILAVFVALFTFVSVQFQLYAAVKNPLNLVALSIILLGALLLFVCLVHLGAGYYRDQPKAFASWVKSPLNIGLATVSVLSLLMLSGGVILMSVAAQQSNDLWHQRQTACSVLSSSIIGALKVKSPAEGFLEKRYMNECHDLWSQ